jgi:hypothetical protein
MIRVPASQHHHLPFGVGSEDKFQKSTKLVKLGKKFQKMDTFKPLFGTDLLLLAELSDSTGRCGKKCA